MEEDEVDSLNDLPEPDPALDALVRSVLGACFAVHTEPGAGLPESHYESAATIELSARGIPFVRQASVDVHYQGKFIGKCRIDIIVDRRLVLEIKAVEALVPVHKSQLLTYLKLTRCHVGLLINVNVASLKQGIKRIINP